MPSIISNTPFLSLRHDENCGRKQDPAVVSSLNGPVVNGDSHQQANGNEKPSAKASEDEFLRLSRPQQDVLLLHGPRKRYSLERAQDVPELKHDREILVQVLAIGLNPVDWKGPDYGFGQPSYPWINGRDFAGIVVRQPRAPSRIGLGDVVCGPSTDYRDVRKAAYQEFVVTTDYNVARLTPQTTVKAGAAIGVAFVAASIALGVSFGLNLAYLKNTPSGPDLLQLVRSVNYNSIPQDVREECFNSISEDERTRPGDWLAIWGASSTTAMFTLQIAKRAGLRVVCVADVAKTGGKLVDLGADVLVDRLDPKRAVEIIKNVTGNRLRFALDTSGKESASFLQQALRRSSDSGQRAHLIGLTGLPKEQLAGIVYHSVPIKIFHDVPTLGETLMAWLEDLFLANAIEMPQIDIAEGGLAGINDALDKLRDGQVSGKRIVVPVGSSHERSHSGSPAPQPHLNGVDDDDDEPLKYHDKINSEPNRIKFAYWVPNVSGGLVISKIPQETKWDYKSNKRYARTAERVGFEYALTQIRFMAGYGAENQHESVSFSQALLHSTRRLKVIAALLPGPWNPAVAAKQIASIDNYSDGRIAVNVVFGWFKAEFQSIGQWWLDHAERYRRGREFITCLRGIWTNPTFTYSGDFYQFHEYPLRPKPIQRPQRPHPEIFQGGNSHDARDVAASCSDVYFMNGNTLEGFQGQIRDVRARARAAGREGQVRFAVNAFVICRETEAEAVRVLREIQGKADVEAVEGFRGQVQNAGAATSNKTGMWANSKFEDLVQYNDGFKTKLIGTPEQIAERICLIKSLGVSILLCAFLHYESEIEGFGRDVLARVRRMEGDGRGTDEGFEVDRTGDVYRERKAADAANGSAQ